MNPQRLAEQLASLELDGLSGCLPDQALRIVEHAAEAVPADRELSAAAVALMDRVDLEEGLDPVVAGVRRERLVRWDAWTSTWIGTHHHDGTPTMVRVLRHPHRERPSRMRWLAREGRALESVLPVHREPSALLLALAGDPATETKADHPSLARRLATAVVELVRWEDAGLGVPSPLPDEVRVTASGVTLACLTARGDPAVALGVIAGLIGGDGGGPLARLARGISHLPPSSTADAAARIRRACADTLAEERHDLAARWQSGLQGSRTARLLDGVRRLQTALPPPPGMGAVGVDLQGHITIVRASADRVTWGPEDLPEVVWDRAEGFRAPLARRLLRARAASPPSPHLDARVGGSPESVEALGRWVAAGLRLRTIQLLLEKTT